MFQCHIALVSGVLELTIQELQELTTLHNKHVVSLAAIAVTLRVKKHVVLWPLYPGIAAVTTTCKKTRGAVADNRDNGYYCYV